MNRGKSGTSNPSTQAPHGVAWFVLLAFGLAWSFWLPALLLHVPLRSALGLALLLPGAFAPAIAAIIVRTMITREGFTDAGFTVPFRKWPYFLLAWLLPLFLMPSIALLAVGLGLGHPNLSVAKAAQRWAAEGGRIPDIPLAGIVLQALIIAVLATPILLGEELGWRGYLQIRLLPGRPLLAASITGLVWGVWHYPINLNGYNFPKHPITGLVVFPVSCILLSMIFGWLLARTGSIWAPSLAHASLNSVGVAPLLIMYPDESTWIFTSPMGLLGWCPLALVVLWLARRRPDSS